MIIGGGGEGEGGGRGGAAPRRRRNPRPHDAYANLPPTHVFEMREGYQHPPLGVIAAQFAKYGFVIVRALTDDECQANIKEQITEILQKQPWQEKLVVRDGGTGEALDIQTDTRRYIKELTRDHLPPATLRHYRDVWPFHRGFGAACDPQVFHLPGVWHVREKVPLYGVACEILGRSDLWVDINRSIQKLPGEGDEEFLHFDLDYMHKDYQPDRAVAGKVLFTDGVFICVPGTATAEFQAEFREQYGRLYPGAKRGDAKFGLDKDKPDPMGLAEKKVAIPVPAGCGIFWSEFLLHGVQKNPRAGHIQWGMYLGFSPAGARPEYARHSGGVGELEDRLYSYWHGVAPKLWPSLDPIHYAPKRFENFPKIMQRYVDKAEPWHEGISMRVIESKGELVPYMVPLVDPHYRAPALTPLGQRLLGLSAWY
jgi:hypothetical protein